MSASKAGKPERDWKVVTSSVAASLLVMEGPEQGKVFKLRSGANVLGRSAEHCDILLEALGVSRRHAKVDYEGGHLTVTDLDSTQGTFVNGLRLHRSNLKNGDRLALGPNSLVEVQGLEPELRLLTRNRYNSEGLDPVTGVFTRQAFLSQVERQRYSSVAILQVDDYPGFIKSYSQQEAQAILLELAQRIQLSLGKKGLLGRLGEEEFVLSFEETLPLATVFCEELQQAVASTGFLLGECLETKSIPLSVSIGLTHLCETSSATLARADKALEKAKQKGLNSLYVN